MKKLTLFYKVVNNQTPDYLSKLVPPTVAETSSYNLRYSQNITQPATVKLWNSLVLSLCQLPTFSNFKLKLQQKYFQLKKKRIIFTEEIGI